MTPAELETLASETARKLDLAHDCCDYKSATDRDCECGAIGSAYGAILAALQRAAGQWVKCSERLPEEDASDNASREVLVCRAGEGMVYQGYYDYYLGEWTVYDQRLSFVGVTHWMPKPPMPEPPAKGET